MADPETERAMGRIEGRLDSLEAKVSDVVMKGMDRIEQGVWRRMDELARDIGVLRAHAAVLDGSKSATERLIDMGLKAVPILTGSGIGAVIMWAIRK